jgi:hypothetical protein
MTGEMKARQQVGARRPGRARRDDRGGRDETTREGEGEVRTGERGARLRRDDEDVLEGREAMQQTDRKGGPG